MYIEKWTEEECVIIYKSWRGFDKRVANAEMMREKVEQEVEEGQRQKFETDIISFGI